MQYTMLLTSFLIKSFHLSRKHYDPSLMIHEISSIQAFSSNWVFHGIWFSWWWGWSLWGVPWGVQAQAYLLTCLVIFSCILDIGYRRRVEIEISFCFVFRKWMSEGYAGRLGIYNTSRVEFSCGWAAVSKRVALPPTISCNS